ncbi:hypothetical protein P4U05_16955 [Bacillus paranthracis]|uniref:hypothetical protein n=1 Tax=Bacillus phage phi4B1 TaxID=1643324 RepID=UPI000200F426|nr:hypothetical protein [Bacillus paranthracis]YP_009206306.1 hypothetical protein XO26_0007 [Bacillus phage phi4B1]ADY20358.1 hypothetical protein YBT020_05560 [Bacillus thuringiensis serovar finitimus YBT-020]MRC72847.1 hypothetical protein [Bacillus thuringiensis]OTX71300.1 hypothetical protein BK722_12870 [Bacillus thuringiensis serovar finitimus]PGZ45702.1 hypothetical protein COE56_25820 [Bacillus anthracis]ALF02594.1 hypothetical protein XO26_0007 [Bacillus phage phi4B1]
MESRLDAIEQNIRALHASVENVARQVQEVKKELSLKVDTDQLTSVLKQASSRKIGEKVSRHEVK